jgi:DNA modification methylase
VMQGSNRIGQGLGTISASRNHLPPVDGVLRKLRSTARVGGITHTFYRYPARFDPSFVRAAIEVFTEPGDVVMDPFMGGGTTAVEALAQGRRFVGVDLNPLSRFITDVKTTSLSEGDRSILLDWAVREDYSAPSRGEIYEGIGWRHVPWWLRGVISRLVETSNCLPKLRLERFARSTILRAAQWALDGRRSLPTSEEFLRIHRLVTQDMITRSFPYRTPGGLEAPRPREPTRLLLTRSSAGIDRDRRITRRWTPIRLVLTSPPYPGVHVLYHRWQVKGRRETSLPYWIAGLEDGFTEPRFTFGPRHDPELKQYMFQFSEAFASVANLLDEDSLIVQLLGFADPETQFPRILDALKRIGLEEVRIDLRNPQNRRAWRQVPNRRWHANMLQGRAGSEVLLVHRLAS